MSLFQNLKQNGWCPSSNDYQVHEVVEPALRKSSSRPRHQKGHVAFKINGEEAPKTAVAAAEGVPSAPETKAIIKNVAETVDQKANMFIIHERKRIELARLKSLNAKG
ncbi:hypothetical protein HN51_030928 [Arachis hypogaea]|uniref:Uncharacterized protein n=1 Tax=Arachis hypogaea TaxID=3818 RepID=A0A445B973_ARAHY|nr:uncharacterized protein DS421_10g295510 [Arachis hypogaea]RYR35227.1 hypothetical protein Ahy_A10g050372 [Arachis hypogaea]